MDHGRLPDGAISMGLRPCHRLRGQDKEYELILDNYEA